MSTQAQLQQYQSHNDQLVGELTTERQLVYISMVQCFDDGNIDRFDAN